MIPYWIDLSNLANPETMRFQKLTMRVLNRIDSLWDMLEHSDREDVILTLQLDILIAKKLLGEGTFEYYLEVNSNSDQPLTSLYSGDCRRRLENQLEQTLRIPTCYCSTCGTPIYNRKPNNNEWNYCSLECAGIEVQPGASFRWRVQLQENTN